jgi:hypothetical protein
MRNRKGFAGITGIILLFVFGAIWVTGLAPLLNDVGDAAVSNPEITGLQAFFYTNLNLLVGFFYILAWFIVLRWGG